MNIKQLVEKNRSFRRFDEKHDVSVEQLTDLIDLARLSPSAANRQPLKYMLITRPEERTRLYPCLAWAGYLTTWEGPNPGERPAAYIIILGDKEISDKFGIDPGIAAQSILLGAAEEGLGGCIFASIKREALRSEFSIPDQYDILNVIALGKPVEQVVIETIKENDVKYWRDDKAVHHVPKRTLGEIIIHK
jgi:nitroreductase